MGTSTTAERTWPIRLIALAAALAMVAAGLVATSAAASANEGDEVNPVIHTPSEGQTVGTSSTLKFRATTGLDRSSKVNVAIRTTTESDEECDWSGNPTNLYLENGLDTDDEGEWSLELNLNELEQPVEPGLYCFAFDADLDGGVSQPNESVRPTVRFYISEEFDGFEPNEIADCTEQECTLDVQDRGQSLTATGTGEAKDGDETSLLGLRIPPDDVSGAVYEACDSLVEDSPLRLGDGIAHLVPVGGFVNDTITVTTTIPREHINNAEPRGNPYFQICVAPGVGEADLYGLDEEDVIEGTGDSFIDPILLDDCDGDDDTACIESRNRIAGADLQITYRLPAADPMLR